jgi:hypothetical protein
MDGCCGEDRQCDDERGDTSQLLHPFTHLFSRPHC